MRGNAWQSGFMACDRNILQYKELRTWTYGGIRAAEAANIVEPAG
jgi:hypothetical protein